MNKDNIRNKVKNKLNSDSTSKSISSYSDLKRTIKNHPTAGGMAHEMNWEAIAYIAGKHGQEFYDEVEDALSGEVGEYQEDHAEALSHVLAMYGGPDVPK